MLNFFDRSVRTFQFQTKIQWKRNEKKLFEDDIEYKKQEEIMANLVSIKQFVLYAFWNM